MIGFSLTGHQPLDPPPPEPSDTDPDAAPDAAPPGPPVSGRRRSATWPVWLTVGLSVLIVAVLVVAAFVRVPYFLIGPGSATPLDDQVVSITGAPTYDHSGDVLYLTVTVSNRDPNLFRYVLARLDPDTEVLRREDVIGCASYDAEGRLAAAEMERSHEVATAVALRHLGYPVTAEYGPVYLAQVECGGPSEGRLAVGDVLVAVDGVPVRTADQVRPLVVAHQPGDRAVFTVQRGDDTREVEVRLGEHDGAAYAGVVMWTDVDYRFPITVTIDTARVSGPSAGLAFALAIVDDLTPGDLTGSGDVAVTGTIAEDGSVGPVGGVAQKTATARRAGARLMLVPVSEVREARAHAGGMRVVGVATFADALRELERAGAGSVTGTTAPGP